MDFSFTLVLLAMAISLDSFSTGIAYGLRKINISYKSIGIIALCTAISVGLSMITGKMLIQSLSPTVANRLGGFILIAIGTWALFQFFRSQNNQSEPTEKIVLKWEIKSLGIVIHILKKPTMADFDQSGSITGFETIILGIALSLDAFGAGIGAAMIGFSPVFLSISACIMSFVFLSSGLHLGNLLSKTSWVEKIAFLPGLLLVIIGLLKM